MLRMKLLRFVLQTYSTSKFHTNRSFAALNKKSSQLITEVKEIEIPMPYGKLAAKAWGHESGKPVLAIPGNQSNCGHYDKLIPLLNNQFYIVAVDCPGQGLSSHRPHGCLYTEIHDLLDYRRAVDFLGWKKFNVLGFSFGASMALLFSSIFPHLIEKLVVFDKVKPQSLPLSDFPRTIQKHFNTYLELEKKMLKPPTVYTYEEMLFEFRQFDDAISLESIDTMLIRNIQAAASGNGFFTNRDVRARTVNTNNLKSHELLGRYLCGVKSELLFLMSKNGRPYMKTDDNDVEKYFDFYRKNSKNFILEYVEGNHLVLMEHPERLAPSVNRFLGD